MIFFSVFVNLWEGSKGIMHKTINEIVPEQKSKLMEIKTNQTKVKWLIAHKNI